MLKLSDDELATLDGALGMAFEEESKSAEFHAGQEDGEEDRKNAADFADACCALADRVAAERRSRKNPAYRCRQCKDTDVQAAMWVHANTDEVVDEVGTWGHELNTFCPTCAGEGRYESSTIEEIPKESSDAAEKE